ncbi:hypothetical protein L0Y49_00845 [bacterium]|nr:hypothetical protein [bacterium]
MKSPRGKWRTLHVSVARSFPRKRLPLFGRIWSFASRRSVNYEAAFDNVAILKKETNSKRWRIHRTYRLGA